MPVHEFQPPRGRLESLRVRSAALAGNRLGDPDERAVAVYVSEGCDASASAPTLLVALAGFTGSGPKLLNWQPFAETLPQRIDRLVASGVLEPVVVALPDCFTSLGGNQYVDSPVLGLWERFLIEDAVPAVERAFRAGGSRERRAVFGRSSGGYGALVHAMRHGDFWGAAACHAPDVDWDLTYRRELPRLLDVLARHGGRPDTFLDAIRAARSIRGDEMAALMLLAMSASYDPDPGAPYGVRLPVDARTCTLVAERWEAWLRHDPLHMVEDPASRRSLARLAGLWIDCGTRDEYGLHYGARALSRRLGELGIPHVFEEFDDTHTGTDYRFDRSLPYLVAALGGRFGRG
jgi:S-formylglutathione hydrolase FrmB